jgi:hypothetical protein
MALQSACLGQMRARWLLWTAAWRSPRIRQASPHLPALFCAEGDDGVGTPQLLSKSKQFGSSPRERPLTGMGATSESCPRSGLLGSSRVKTVTLLSESSSTPHLLGCARSALSFLPWSSMMLRMLSSQTPLWTCQRFPKTRFDASSITASSSTAVS